MAEPRYAVVEGAAAETVTAYLPGNYQVVGSVWLPGKYGDNLTSYVLVAGQDNAGWTLDDYVIPRLQSGLYSVRELVPA